MSQRGEKLIIGQRLRVLRQSLGLTQAQMADQLGVSASYVTLIEADQRPASARFLMKLAEVYDLNIAELAPSTDAQLAAEFTAALKDPALQTGTLSRTEIEAVLQASPRIAAAFVRLHDSHREELLRPLADENPLTDRDKVEVLAGSSRAVDAVRNWFYARHNYVDALDRAAEGVANELAMHRNEALMVLTHRLAGHGIAVRILPVQVMGEQLRRYDPHRGELMLSELLGQASRRFQISVLLARLEQEALIAELVAESDLPDPAAVTLLRVSLANYYAAALMMPYGRFLAACESARYDVELLGHRFGASFEQTAHRMSTLQRPDARGIPFFFVRVDQAGNISKRFSAGRFPFSRFGGTCPLWNIHAAFEMQGRVQTQVIRMPEGASYFSIARTVTRAGGSYGAPAQKLAIGLGCDVSYAPRLVYADGIDLERTRPVDIGLNCYLCERRDCAARAHAPINRRLKVNERERSLAIYEFEGE
ncbi:helix-turn-helix domain-containing protein [Paracoccus shanxieyensis]|uniref:Helix-turn-helix domain-containing protein n=1 Tax=Paracoccus shanxieyensis TaxID=2675752 RepID=A0A6L6J057_9RHOB|nr:XRE family transcriptional regulator [Paracoccus shanxieyensis]MTH64037.1 helix-turn-helix domain-containing protein [Paracoccus shanxieyensis]MTH86922.1 helix-turn-helix domain-containing protein [Paracoccus shanxieyensis]